MGTSTPDGLVQTDVVGQRQIMQQPESTLIIILAAIILLLGSLTVVGTLISDLLLAVVDPRIRLTGGR